jgi:hypothetical protein
MYFQKTSLISGRFFTMWIYGELLLSWWMDLAEDTAFFLMVNI